MILPFLDDDNLPDKTYIESHSQDDGLTHDGRLLYVAVTRARTGLVLLYDNERTRLLPEAKSLFHEVRL